MGLRPYQKEDLQKIKDLYDSGERRLLGVAATGLGKTKLFSSIYQVIPNTGKMLVIVNREELIKQSVKAIQAANPDLSVGVEQAGNRAEDHHDVVVASIQTIGSVKEDEDGDPVFNKRILSLKQEEFSVVIVDECLTGDSLVLTENGLVRIDDPRILSMKVLSYHDTLKLWELKTVNRWLPRGKKKTITIKTQHSAIRCTENHPIMTKRGWVKAGEITSEDEILSPAKVSKWNLSRLLKAFTGKRANADAESRIYQGGD